MKNYDFRIKKLEEILNPKGKTVTVVTINYIIDTSESGSFIKINGQKNLIPDGVNIKDFIAEKVSGYSGVVCCSIFLTNNLCKE